MEALLAAESLTVPLSYAVTISVALMMIFAGFCGWLANTSITLGKLVTKTEVRIENIEKVQDGHIITLVNLDERLDKQEQRITSLEQTKNQTAG